MTASLDNVIGGDVERVVFAADFLRRGIFSQPPPVAKSKIGAIHRLLGWQLGEATGLPVEVIADFDGERFYQENGCERSPTGWARLSHVERFAPGARERIRVLFDKSLVVGFELPESVVRTLSELEIPYVDMLMHPVRYLDDIFLALRSGSPAVFERLLEFRLDEGRYRMHAGIFRCRTALSSTTTLADDSLLFLGQTSVDRSLIGGGRLLGLSDFREEFEALCSEHEKVYFKRHPMAKDDARDIDYLQSVANVELIEDNAYELLSRDEITRVGGISSGALYEARYFGKRVEYLLAPTRAFAGEGSDLTYGGEKYVSIFGHYFDPSFWSQVLSPAVPTRRTAELRLSERINRLRDAFNLYWAYPRPGADA